MQYQIEHWCLWQVSSKHPGEGERIGTGMGSSAEAATLESEQVQDNDRQLGVHKWVLGPRRRDFDVPVSTEEKVQLELACHVFT